MPDAPHQIAAKAPTQAAAARHRRLLMVSQGLPPGLNGSSAIIGNLAMHFGKDEMTLIGEAFAGPRDPEQMAALPDIHYLTSDLKWPKRGQRYVRWIRWFRLFAVRRHIEQLARAQRAEAIVGVFPDEFYLTAACWAARRLKLPFYPYFHNTYVDNRKGLSHAYAEWLQPRVFSTARIVFVWNDGLRAYYESVHPGLRFETLPYVLNETLPEPRPLPPVGKPLQIALLGNLNESNLDATTRFLNLLQDPAEVQFTVYTSTPDWYYRKMGINGTNLHFTRVAQTEVTTALATHDVLFLPHGLSGGFSDVEYQTIFPTRTVSYLVAGRPILAHSPPGSFVTNWLRRFDCAELVEQPDVAQLRAALTRVRDDSARREQLVQNARRAAAEFEAERVVGHFRRQLDESIAAAN